MRDTPTWLRCDLTHTSWVDHSHPAVFLSTCFPDPPSPTCRENRDQSTAWLYPETPAVKLLRCKSESDDSACSSLSFSQRSSPDECLHPCTIYRFTYHTRVWKLIHSFILNCHKEIVKSSYFVVIKGLDYPKLVNFSHPDRFPAEHKNKKFSRMLMLLFSIN